MSEGQAERVSVVLIDDHRMFAETLSHVLADEPDIDVLGIAHTASDGIALVHRDHPAVVLIDYRLPDHDGIYVIGEIQRDHPEISCIILTGSGGDRVLLGAIEAGCSGFITKERAALEVANAIRTVARGEALISPELLGRLLPRLSRTHRAVGHDLTERELEILRLVARGRSNREIATELHLSVNTVRNYVQTILRKLNAHSKLEAVSVAVREGVIDYTPES